MKHPMFFFQKFFSILNLVLDQFDIKPFRATVIRRPIIIQASRLWCQKIFLEFVSERPQGLIIFPVSACSTSEAGNRLTRPTRPARRPLLPHRQGPSRPSPQPVSPDSAAQPQGCIYSELLSTYKSIILRGRGGRGCFTSLRGNE